jgi:uridine phosphorylase
VKSNASSGCSHADETAGSQICFSYADSDLLRACETAAQTLQTPYAIGPTRCHDALYLREKPQLDEFYSSKGIYASDMETASIFAVSALRGIRAASILNVVVEWKKDLAEGISSYHDGEDAAAKGEENEIRTALEALHLIEGR